VKIQKFKKGYREQKIEVNLGKTKVMKCEAGFG